MENKVLLFGPDSVWVNVFYGDRPVRSGEEHKVRRDARKWLMDVAREECVTCLGK